MKKVVAIFLIGLCFGSNVQAATVLVGDVTAGELDYISFIESYAQNSVWQDYNRCVVPLAVQKLSHGSRLWLNGQAGKTYLDIKAEHIVCRGQRVVYLATIADGASQKGVIVDGQQEMAILSPEIFQDLPLAINSSGNKFAYLKGAEFWLDKVKVIDLSKMTEPVLWQRPVVTQNGAVYSLWRVKVNNKNQWQVFRNNSKNFTSWLEPQIFQVSAKTDEYIYIEKNSEILTTLYKNGKGIVYGAVAQVFFSNQNFWIYVVKNKEKSAWQIIGQDKILASADITQPTEGAAPPFFDIWPLPNGEVAYQIKTNAAPPVKMMVSNTDISTVGYYELGAKWNNIFGQAAPPTLAGIFKAGDEMALKILGVSAQGEIMIQRIRGQNGAWFGAELFNNSYFDANISESYELGVVANNGSYSRLVFNQGSPRQPLYLSATDRVGGKIYFKTKLVDKVGLNSLPVFSESGKITLYARATNNIFTTLVKRSATGVVTLETPKEIKYYGFAGENSYGFYQDGKKLYRVEIK